MVQQQSDATRIRIRTVRIRIRAFRALLEASLGFETKGIGTRRKSTARFGDVHVLTPTSHQRTTFFDTDASCICDFRIPKIL